MIRQVLSAFAIALMMCPSVLARKIKPNIIVIYTDDHGYSDLGCQGVSNDVKTPNIDWLAQSGVRMTDGYCTAPQCVPSRGGLISGLYQNRFGLESNPQFKDAEVMKRFDQVMTIGERLQEAGYITGMAGKWHLGEEHQITRHGFHHVFFKHSNAPGLWNMDFDGNDFATKAQKGGGYHLDLISDFACAFIERFNTTPFFFYAAYRAPHVPLDAPKYYLNRFPGEMPERRRQALAMISAIDDGVGRILSELVKHNLEDDTLIFVISDNGAPLKIHKADAPGGGPGWDGSVNDPLNGEKGMLTEGGIRVPFVVRWKGKIPAGQVFHHPVITLDVAATANALAGLPEDPQLDGVNLIPYLCGELAEMPQRALFWRWLGQSAIRKGKWKYLRSDNRQYLFDMNEDVEETRNLMREHPEVADRMYQELTDWTKQLSPQGIWAVKSEGMSRQAAAFYDWYLDKKRDRGTENSSQGNRSKNEQSNNVTDVELLFAKRDVNHDDVVTLDEFIAGRTGAVVRTLTRRFKQLNSDGDGRWTIQQSAAVSDQ